MRRIDAEILYMHVMSKESFGSKEIKSSSRTIGGDNYFLGTKLK